MVCSHFITWQSDVYLQERLMEASDAFRVHVDARSGLLAAANLKNQTFTSLTGDKSAEIVQVR